MAHKRVKTPRIIVLLQTPEGQKVLQAAADSLARKLDFDLAYRRAVREAEKYGILSELQLALIQDIVEYGVPLLVDLVQNLTRKKRQPRLR